MKTDHMKTRFFSYIAVILFSVFPYTHCKAQTALSSRTEFVNPFLPAPVEISISKGLIPFKSPVGIIMPEKPSMQHLYTLDILQKQLIRLNISSSPCSVANANHFPSIIVLGETDHLDAPQKVFLAAHSIKIEQLSDNPEAYFFQSKQGKDQTITVLIGNSASGTLYSAFLFLQIINNEGIAATIPELVIRDQPALAVRGWCGPFPGALPRSEWNNPKILDWLAFCRINAVYIEYPGWTDSFFSSDTLPQELDTLISECHKRGIKAYAMIGILGINNEAQKKQRSYIGKDKKDIEQLCSYFSMYRNAGCDGFVMLFDDIHDPSMQEKMKGHSETFVDMEISLIKGVVKLAREYDIKDIYICPTYYHSASIDNVTREYLQEFGMKIRAMESELPWAKNVKYYYTDMSEQEMSIAHKYGLSNLSFWYNGMQNKGVINVLSGTDATVAFAPLEWGYSGTNDIRDWSDYDVYGSDKFHSLPQRTNDAWLCCGTADAYRLAEWGIYAWNPARFNQRVFDNVFFDRIFGKGAGLLMTTSILSASIKGGIFTAGLLPQESSTLVDVKTLIKQARHDMPQLKSFYESKRSSPELWNIPAGSSLESPDRLLAKLNNDLEEKTEYIRKLESVHIKNMPVFDDFKEKTLDGNKWTVVKGTGTTIIDGWLNIKENSVVESASLSILGKRPRRIEFTAQIRVASVKKFFTIFGSTSWGPKLVYDVDAGTLLLCNRVWRSVEAKFSNLMAPHRYALDLTPDGDVVLSIDGNVCARIRGDEISLLVGTENAAHISGISRIAVLGCKVDNRIQCFDKIVFGDFSDDKFHGGEVSVKDVAIYCNDL